MRLVWLLVAVFAAEWLLLGIAIKAMPDDELPRAVIIIVVLTIIGGWVAVYLRVQRRMR